MIAGNFYETSLADGGASSSWHSTVSSDADAPQEVPLCDPVAAHRAARSAARASQNMALHSRVVDPVLEEAIPPLGRAELILGRLLGKGGFNDVYEVSRILLKRHDKSGTQHTSSTQSTSSSSSQAVEVPRSWWPLEDKKADVLDDDQKLDDLDGYRATTEKARETQLRREFLAEHAIRAKTNDARYAVKFLSRNTMMDPRHFRTGAADLAMEAKFLSSLEHPNIIKMRAVAAAGTAGFKTGLLGGYFIVLDRLHDTLDKRIETWKDAEKKSKTFMQRKILDKHGKKRKLMLAHRLNVAFDVCAAINYLHSRNVIYRDLKPDNIGFDVRGDVKLFDFGLAKEINPNEENASGMYEMSGNTGSLRYMAPEVARSDPYNLSADVYSFGILLWEICALEQPYEDMTRRTHADYVVHGTYRPSLEGHPWSVPLRSLMERAWSPDPFDRPRMESAYKILRREIASLRDGDDTGLEHARRRSTYVLDPRALPNSSRATAA